MTISVPWRPQLDLVELFVTIASLPAERCRTSGASVEQPAEDAAHILTQYTETTSLLTTPMLPSLTQYTTSWQSSDGETHNFSLTNFSLASRKKATPGWFACGPVPAFDNRLLPYRWLPGLPVAPPTPTRLSKLEDDLRKGKRIEVMHLADFWPGPVWLYAAPGSGVWWTAGRHVVARNLVAALLHFKPLSEVVAHLSLVRNGDRRFARYRNYLQWRAAFGSVPWERVLLGAAAGNGSFAYLSAAGEMLSALLTKEPPEGIDSVILLQQPHYWPRGAGWGDGISPDDGFAPTMVAPCAHERAAVRDRIHFTTEIVDFRARRAAKAHKKGWPTWRSNQEVPPQLFDYLTADAAGTSPCHQARSSIFCTSCSAATDALCYCATMKSALVKGAGYGRPSALIHPKIDIRAARKCCVRQQQVGHAQR